MLGHAMVHLTFSVLALPVIFTNSAMTQEVRPAPQALLAQATPVDQDNLGNPSGTSPNVHYVTWANVNRWDVQIESASIRFGVPPEYLKAVIAKESGGYWDDPKTGGIIQNPDSHATGLVQAMPDAGNEELAQSLQLSKGYTDPGENIMLGAAILAEKHQIAISMGYAGETAWQVATGGYFGVWPATMAESDATGTSGTQYVSDVSGMVNEIRAAARGAAAPTPPLAATPSN
jgi:hypothetical protein